MVATQRQSEPSRSSALKTDRPSQTARHVSPIATALAHSPRMIAQRQAIQATFGSAATTAQLQVDVAQRMTTVEYNKLIEDYRPYYTIDQINQFIFSSSGVPNDNTERALARAILQAGAFQIRHDISNQLQDHNQNPSGFPSVDEFFSADTLSELGIEPLHLDTDQSESTNFTAADNDQSNPIGMDQSFIMDPTNFPPVEELFPPDYLIELDIDPAYFHE